MYHLHVMHLMPSQPFFCSHACTCARSAMNHIILLMYAVTLKPSLRQDTDNALLQLIDGCNMMTCRRSINISRERFCVEDWSVCMIRMNR